MELEPGLSRRLSVCVSVLLVLKTLSNPSRSSVNSDLLRSQFRMLMKLPTSIINVLPLFSYIWNWGKKKKKKAINHTSNHRKDEHSFLPVTLIKLLQLGK